MDIAALRKRLALTPHDALSFGAPDRTGWANVEIVDTLTGDFRVVGQLRGSAFRPMGASQATMHLGPRVTDVNPAVEREAQHEEFFGGLLAGPTIIGLFLAWCFWQDGPLEHVLVLTLRRGTWEAIGLVVAILLWDCLVFKVGGWFLADDHAAIMEPLPARLSPAEAMPSDDFRMATVNCPHCGSPVSDDGCLYCGWTRDL
jgi:hypothetical protein